MADYYGVLGVGRDATQDDIKKAFRRLARETHPDANPGDPQAETRFRQIAEAYEVLSDPQRRGAYDRGETIGTGDLFSNFAGIDDLLQQFFGGGGLGGFGGGRGGPRRGTDVALAVELTLAEAASGVSRELRFRAATACNVCGGSGSEPGHTAATCPTCGGRGQVQVRRDTFLGAMMTVSDCTSCRGTGRIIEHPCHECRGRGRIDDERQLAVDIPEGVDTGTRLRLAGRGGAGEPGGPPGDLYVEIKVLRDPQLDRHGDDLHHRVNLGFAEATLGTEVEVPLVDGATERMTIPAGTQPGTVFRIAKRGMPRLRRRGRGDLLVTASVEVPASVTEDEEALLLQWAELRSENATEGKRRRRRRSR